MAGAALFLTVYLSLHSGTGQPHWLEASSTSIPRFHSVRGLMVSKWNVRLGSPLRNGSRRE